MKSTVAYFWFHWRELENLGAGIQSSDDFQSKIFIFDHFVIYNDQAMMKSRTLEMSQDLFCVYLFKEWDRVKAQLNCHGKKTLPISKHLDQTKLVIKRIYYMEKKTL